MGSTASRTSELWRDRVLAQRASGLSVRGWCRANGCPEHGFYCWRARLGLSPVSGRQRRRARRAGSVGWARGAGSVGFARVVVEPVAPDAWPLAGPPVAGPPVVAQPLRLTLAGGRELALPASMPVEQVARLVRAIEAADRDAAADRRAGADVGHGVRPEFAWEAR